MVYLSQIFRRDRRVLKTLRGTYLDKVRILVKGGSGGMGNPKHGGIGGKGGDVYLEATEVPDLRVIQSKFPDKRIAAGNGGNSNTKQLLGERGKDVTIIVPCGVKAISDFHTVIGEVNKVGERVILAKGGIGGCPSTLFSGKKGEKFNLCLELSVVSDVSIVGFPNAGKSTFLKACSNAKPRIADYPFTTIKPNLGVMEFSDQRKITIADLPGLIEGAHQNFGMGHKFLRHVERCRCIMMIIDVSGFQLRANRVHRTAFETVMLLNKELELYNSDLLKKPVSLIVNKMDLPNAGELFIDLKEKLNHSNDFVMKLPEFMRPEMKIEFTDIIPISAKAGRDVETVKSHLRSVIDGMAEENDDEINERLIALKNTNKEFGPDLV